jgi:hypothetical protein
LDCDWCRELSLVLRGHVRESEFFLSFPLIFLQIPSNQQLDGSMDSAQRTQQVCFFLSRQLIRSRHCLSPLRLHHQSELLGVGFPLLRNLWDDLVGYVAVFRELIFFPLTFSRTNLFKVFDSPEKHPRIHPEEREYILKTLGSSVRRSGDEKSKIPWKAIFTSKPVWLIAIAQWGGIWGYFTIITQGPTYLTTRQSFSVSSAPSALPPASSPQSSSATSPSKTKASLPGSTSSRSVAQCSSAAV